MPGSGRPPWRRDRLPTPVFLGFPGGSAGEEPTCHAGDLGLIPGTGRSPGEGKGYPLQNLAMDSTVHGVTKSQTRQSDLDSPFHSGDRSLHTRSEEQSVGGRKSSHCSDMSGRGLAAKWLVGQASRLGGVQGGVQADSGEHGCCCREDCVSRRAAASGKPSRSPETTESSLISAPLPSTPALSKPRVL